MFGFIAGSVIGAWHFEFWTDGMPTFEPFSLAENTGVGFFGAWLIQLIFFGIVIWFTFYIKKKKNPPPQAPVPTESGWKRIVRGAWPLWGAALILAVLNAATLLSRGEPWGITSAFALWGSQVVQAVGIDVTQWGYWSGDAAEPLNQSVFLDTTSVMNFGLMTGAFIASATGGLFALKKIPFKTAMASLIGGIMMGYGARIAFGCNIGAYFGGIASFSLHGWLWAVMAILGTFVALKLRPLFGLSVPKSDDRSC